MTAYNSSVTSTNLPSERGSSIPRVISDVVDFSSTTNAASDTFDVLRNTKCIFGPSSGPIHLSSLCGCPHVVWGDQSKSLNRHYTNWNPLGTKVLFLDRFLYHPPPEYVFDKFKKWDLK
jgi:hypothetical protein